MKKVLTLTFVILSSFLYSQEIKGYFVSTSYDEYVWEQSINKYVYTKSSENKSSFKANKDSICFKKDNIKWLANGWAYKGNFFDNGSEYVTYMDELNQKLVFSKDRNYLDYYYNWNDSLSVYMNYCRYNDLITTNESYLTDIQKDKKILKAIAGTYTFINACYLDYNEWDSLRNNEDFGLNYYKDYPIKKAEITIGQETISLDKKSIFYLTLSIDGVIVYKHPLTKIDERSGFNDAYDVESGKHVISLFLEDDPSAVLFYGYNITKQVGERVYIFNNQKN